MRWAVARPARRRGLAPGRARDGRLLGRRGGVGRRGGFFGAWFCGGAGGFAADGFLGFCQGGLALGGFSHRYGDRGVTNIGCAWKLLMRRRLPE